MLTFLLVVAALGIPIILLMWKKRFLAGIVAGGVVFLYAFIWFWIQVYFGPAGWIGNYEFYILNFPGYDNRWKIPVFLDWVLLIVPFMSQRWLLWLFLSSAAWWSGIILFYFYLRYLEYTKLQAMFMTVMPLLTLGGIQYSIMTADALFWFVIVLGFWAVQLLLLDGIREGIRKTRFWIISIICILLGIFTLWLVPPVPPSYGGYFIYLLTEPVELIVGLHVFWVFIIEGIWRIKNDIPKHIKYSLFLLPLFIIMCIYGVDWHRWAMLAAPIWAPLVIIGLEYFIDRMEATEPEKIT